MNKKVILQIISILMAISVIFTVGGCKNSSDDDRIVNAKGNPVQPTIDEQDQAIIKYTTVNADGKEEEATTAIEINSPSVDEVTLGSSLEQQYKSDDQKQEFVNKVENNGIDKDTAQDIINNAEKWAEFSYTIYVANTSSQLMHARYLTVGNKISDVAVETNLDAEYGICSGTGYPIYISGYVNIAAYPDEESLIVKLNEMKVQLIYTLTDNTVADIDDWDTVETKLMDINFK